MNILDEIKDDETKIIELKEELPKENLKWLKTIIGFSNSIGGKLVIGIEDGTQKVRGIDKDYLPLLVDKINNIIADSITPKIIPNMYKEIIEDKIVLIVEICFGESTPYHLKTGRPEDSTYIRYYGSTRLSDELTYKELYLRGQKSYFDSQPYQIAKPLTDEELSTFCKRMTEFSIEHANDKERNSVRELTVNQLNAWGVIVERGGKFYPSNAYMLLTDENPFEFCKIQCGRFKGLNRSIFIDKKEYTGAICNQIDWAYKFVRNYLQVGLTIHDIVSFEKDEIPEFPLREIITNAQVHRLIDTTTSTQVMVYDDRVEIMSPGGPYGNQTISKITSGWSSLRNPSLAKMFKYLHLIDNWGTGLERSIRMCNELGIKVEVLNDGIGIRVNIYRPSYKPEEQINNQQQNHLSQELYDNLTEQERTIVNFIKEHGSIRRITVEDLLNIKDTRANEILSILVKKGMISKEGGSKNIKYVLK